MNATLRIKRVYFDQILSGEKSIEYRDVKPFYERMFERNASIKTLTLHYQRGRKLICDVIAVHRMPTPDWFADENDGIVFGPETYAIHVRNARLIAQGA
jgi:hypothetical protein